MTVRGVPAPMQYQPPAYWEDRARRFAGERDGLAAVCAYGMPEFYNRAIDWEQRLALDPWLRRVEPGTRVLDVGCGIGRWSRFLAARGAVVFGVDLSSTMIAQARRRAAMEDVTSRCRFAVADLVHLDLKEQFDLVLGVTVLQHILDPASFRSAISAMASHVAPQGRMILLEAAPTAPISRCDSTVFTARHRDVYLETFRTCGLEVRALSGVDPATFTKKLLPHLRNLPRGAGLSLVALATALSLPFNILFGRRALQSSWHAVFVLEHKKDGSRP